MQTILTLTMNPALDVSFYVDRVIPEHKLRCSAPIREPGGGGINVSRAIKKLGGESQVVFPAGGPTGQMLEQLLKAEAVDHVAIPTEHWTREGFIAYEEATGQQFRFGMPGPALREPEWRECLKAIEEEDSRPDYIVASGSLPPGVPDDFYAQLAQLTKTWPCKLIVDASGEALRHAANAGVFLLKPNARELGQLAGKDISDEEVQEEVACEYARKGKAEAVVVSLGAQGAMFVTSNECRRFRAPSVAVRSKVGAGDSMVAGMVLSLVRGKSLVEAVRFGIAAGAAAVMSPGTELCRREDAERLVGRVS